MLGVMHGTGAAMNAGNRAPRWLFDERLKVDREWSESTASGFRWWADHNAQTIEVVGTEEGPEGTAYLVSVRTAYLRSVELDPAALAKIDAVLMSFASLAGPVYDPVSKKLTLCSLVRVHDGIFDWIKEIIALAAVLQVGEARITGSLTAAALGAMPDLSGHPTHGFRPSPDELAEIISLLVAPRGQEPCRWTPAEFQETVDQFLQKPPSVMATGGGSGLTAEFPYGDASSLLQMAGDQPHPRYGNGLFVLQSFPVDVASGSEGARLALQLNACELAGWGHSRAGGYRPSGYGLGSYAYRDRTIHFTAFYPNLMYAPGLLPILCSACAWRAQQMDIRLTGQPWNEASFGPDHASVFRVQAGLARVGRTPARHSADSPTPTAPPTRVAPGGRESTGSRASAGQMTNPSLNGMKAEQRREPCDTHLELVGVSACIDGIRQVFDEHFRGQKVKRITKTGRRLDDLDCVLVPEPEPASGGAAPRVAVIVGSARVGYLGARDAASYHSLLARLAHEHHLLASGTASVWAQLQDDQRIKARVSILVPTPKRFGEPDRSVEPPTRPGSVARQPEPRHAPPAPAGWYPDPTDRRAVCWWDGSRWHPQSKHFPTPGPVQQPGPGRVSP